MSLRGHVRIANKDYLITDESYQSQIVPLFRPQLVVEGVGREAAEQYLYLAQDTWDRGTYLQARELNRWQNGNWARIEGVDNSIPSKLSLQRAVSISKAFPRSFDTGGWAKPIMVRLISVAGWLFAFRENGEVWRLGNQRTDAWQQVAFDDATHGAVTAVEIATAAGTNRGEGSGVSLSGGGGGGGLQGSVSNPIIAPVMRGGEYATRLLVGTTTGRVLILRTSGTRVAPSLAVVSSYTIPAPHAGRRVEFVKSYRNFIVFGVENAVYVKKVTEDGLLGDNKLVLNLPGAIAAMQTWRQLMFVGLQTSSKGSMIAALDANQFIDSDTIDGFMLQSMAVWGGNLIYGGRSGPLAEVYIYPGKAAERLPPDNAPADVVAMLSRHRHLLIGWNARRGVYWMHDKGAGPLVEHEENLPRDGYPLMAWVGTNAFVKSPDGITLDPSVTSVTGDVLAASDRELELKHMWRLRRSDAKLFYSEDGGETWSDQGALPVDTSTNLLVLPGTSRAAIFIQGSDAGGGPGYIYKKTPGGSIISYAYEPITDYEARTVQDYSALAISPSGDIIVAARHYWAM